MAFDLSNYVDVKTRIQQFKEKYPEGSLQPLNHDKPYDIVVIGSETFIVYVACAYRSPDDARPGIGIAQERYPGRSNYTKDSEFMNAETSAWGRAIVAALATDTSQGIASYEEVRNRTGADSQRDNPNPTTGKQEAVIAKVPATSARKSATVTSIGKVDSALTQPQIDFLNKLKTGLEMSDSDIFALAGCNVSAMDSQKASALINDLLALKKGTADLIYKDDGSAQVHHKS